MRAAQITPFARDEEIRPEVGLPSVGGYSRTSGPGVSNVPRPRRPPACGPGGLGAARTRTGSHVQLRLLVSDVLDLFSSTTEKRVR
jgi:hypothetical protein